MRTAKPTLKKVTIKGKAFWQVTQPDPGSKRPKRKTFKDKTEANTCFEAAKIQNANFGAAAFSISDSLRTDAIAAAAVLNGTGKTLLDAARFFLADLTRISAGQPMKDAIDAFLASRSSESASYKKTLTSRMELLKTLWSERNTASVTTIDCQGFLDALPHAPQTVAHYRAHLVAFFTFCQARDWCVSNPAERTTQPKVRADDITILTTAQASALLRGCDTSILPGVTLGLFCGLRQAEIERLDWSAINLTEKTVKVGANVAKTNSRRVVSISANAVKWLQQTKVQSGPVWPGEKLAREPWTLARIHAGFGPFFEVSNKVRDLQKDRKSLTSWPSNALRHSAISYRLAITKDLPKIAYESGNSPAVIQRHYNGLATPRDAKAFFSILPPANLPKGGILDSIAGKIA